MHQIDDNDDPAEVLRIARMAVKEANHRALYLQSQTTQQLVQRVKDLKYWSGEIDRELQDLKEDNEDIYRYYRKLKNCVDITFDAIKVNEICFAVRRKRTQVDNNDRVDALLNKEKDTINDCIKQMKEYDSIIEKQSELNLESKNRLMRDYTLKQEAVNLDHKAAAFGVEHRYAAKKIGNTDLEYRDMVPMQRMSDYHEWIENTALNLNLSAKARAKSRKIIQRLINSARDMAQLMRQEAINVDNTLKDSVKNWTKWRDAIQAQLNAKDKEIKIADNAIKEINFSLKLSGSPLQIALMRQSQRGLRPGIELCNDKAQHALQTELNNLKTSMLSLEHQLDRAKESRRRMSADHFRLRRKLEICEQNLAIDYELLRNIRTNYPQEIQLSGFLVGELPKAVVK